MLGLPRADVVRRRSITEFHLPEELDDAGGGLAGLVRTAQEQGRDVRDWTYVAADGAELTVSVAVTPHRRPRRARRVELRRHRHDRGPGDRAHEGPVRGPGQPRAPHAADLHPGLP